MLQLWDKSGISLKRDGRGEVVKNGLIGGGDIAGAALLTSPAMDHRGQRPPRAARPPGQPQSQPPPHSQSPPSYPAYSAAYASPAYPDQPASAYRPPPHPQPGFSPRGVSFQRTEVGDRHEPLDQTRQRQYSAYQSTSPPPMDVEGVFADGRVGRKKSLVRPDREKIDPGHRQWHYRNHAAQLVNDGGNAIASRAYPSLHTLALIPTPPCSGLQRRAMRPIEASCVAESRCSGERRTSTSPGSPSSSGAPFDGRGRPLGPLQTLVNHPSPGAASTTSALDPRTPGLSTVT